MTWRVPPVGWTVHQAVWVLEILLPAVYVIHDVIYEQFPEQLGRFSRLKRFYLRWVVRMGLRKARQVIAVSNYTKGEVVRCFGQQFERKIQVIYEGWEHLPLASNLSPLTYNLNHWEVTPGVFAEYTYTYKDKVTLLMGIREDYSTRYGFFTTPRMNIRYAPFEWWTLRGSIGFGYRSPNAIADNAAYLASNRMYYFNADSLAQERSMNMGLSTVFYIPIGKRELQLSGEYYYTEFHDGIIADMDRSLHGITLYNMHDVDGARYFSHNWQVEATMEILRGWTMTAAFRYTDVKQTTFNTIAN